MAFVKNLLFKHPSTAALRSEVEGLRERLAKAEAAELRASSSLFMSIVKGLVTVPHRGHRLEIENPYLAAAAGLAESTTQVNPLVVRRLTTAAKRAECLAGPGGSCDCCQGITCVTASKDLDQLSDEDDCVLLKGDNNVIDATSPRLKRPWLFLASARRVGKRRRRCHRRRGLQEHHQGQRLPRPSEFPIRRRLVRARAARRSGPRFARARREDSVTTRSSSSPATRTSSRSASPASIRDPPPSSPRPRARGPTLASTLRARAGQRRRGHAHRQVRQREPPRGQRLPRPSGIPLRRRLVRARGRTLASTLRARA